MRRRNFLKFSILLSLTIFYNLRNVGLSCDNEIVIIDGWILKKSDLL